MSHASARFENLVNTIFTGYFFQDIDTFKNGMRKRDTLGEGMCSASHNISTSDGNSEKRIMYIVFVRSLLVTGHHKSQ